MTIPFDGLPSRNCLWSQRPRVHPPTAPNLRSGLCLPKDDSPPTARPPVAFPRGRPPPLPPGDEFPFCAPSGPILPKTAGPPAAQPGGVRHGVRPHPEGTFPSPSWPQPAQTRRPARPRPAAPLPGRAWGPPPRPLGRFETGFLPNSHPTRRAPTGGGNHDEERLPEGAAEDGRYWNELRQRNFHPRKRMASLKQHRNMPIDEMDQPSRPSPRRGGLGLRRREFRPPQWQPRAANGPPSTALLGAFEDPRPMGLVRLCRGEGAQSNGLKPGSTGPETRALNVGVPEVSHERERGLDVGKGASGPGRAEAPSKAK